jgi:3-phenylpropionate/cinnamic acid dioxygenase small subunit
MAHQPPAAHEAVRNLLGRYCELMDAADWQAVGELFASAELAGPDGRVIASGSDAVAALYRRGTQLHDGSPRTRHVTANSVVEIDGDRATARSSYVVFQGVDGFALQPIITGRYADSFARTDGGWRFARRQFFVDHVGDLSHHLTYEVPAQ